MRACIKNSKPGLWDVAVLISDDRALPVVVGTPRMLWIAPALGLFFPGVARATGSGEQTERKLMNEFSKEWLT